MAAELTVLDGSTYFVSAPSGDVEAAEAEGFFHADMRHLSLWRLLVEGEPLRILTSRCVDYYSARIVGVPAEEPTAGPMLSVRRDRFVADGLHEDLVVENAGSDLRRLRLELRFGSDFADILECKQKPAKHGRTRVEVDDRAAYETSLLDLAALRFNPRHTKALFPPAAGLPWFMALFGRDSLIAGYEALPFKPELAEAALRALAPLQAREFDDFHDAEPGKIPHELRYGELTALGETPHDPYYGSHDATPLFLIVLDEYERWTGDRALVCELEPTARRALAWLEGAGDLDGDGYLEYRSRSSAGLSNHGWKDSDDAIRFADGRFAVPPIATCELQAYACDARLRTARPAREVWRTRTWPSVSSATRRSCATASTAISGSTSAGTTRWRSTPTSARSTPSRPTSDICSGAGSFPNNGPRR